MKLNCWEYMKCGRGPDASASGVISPCPVALESRLDGIHEGTNAGRTCWVVGGTFCNGEVAGTFAKKALSCYECDFYRSVHEEEYPRFVLSSVLLAMLRDSKSQRRP